MSCQVALEQWLNAYQQQYQTELSEFPRHYAGGETSPCVVDSEEHEPVQWQTVKREIHGTFANVEQALSLSLHPDINEFYGSFWAGPLHFDSSWGAGELLQAWNEDDFARLQQNVIGHLMMKRKLKQQPTWFIGLLANGDDMICIKNDDGSVWREKPGDEPSEKLANSIEHLLQQLTPKVTQAVEYQMPTEEITTHPGIFASLQRMWHNLFPSK